MFYFFSWTNKRDNRVFDVAEMVRSRLRRISNSINKEEMQLALKDLRSWNRYKGKIKAWFEGEYVNL